MKLVFAVVLAALLGGISAGYYYGRVYSKLGEYRTISDHIVIDGIQPYDDIRLIYQCNNDFLASYSIVRKKLTTSASLAELRQNGPYNRNKSSQNPWISNNIEAITAFFTGSGLVAFSKPLISALKNDENRRYTIPGLLAGLSGFYLGYSYATRTLPPCDALFTLLLVSKENTWIDITNIFVDTLSLKALLIAFDDEKIKEAVDRITKRESRSDIPVKDFVLVATTVGALKSNSETLKTPEAKNYSYQTYFDNFILIIVPSVLCLLLAFFAFKLLTKRFEDGRLRAEARRRARANKENNQ